ncbi:MAG: DoxX family protein [Pseudomonadota bacterium]
MRKLLLLNSAQRFADFALLLLRVFVGIFLIWSVWDKVTGTGQMHEFAEFLRKHHFPSPEIAAPVSAYLQMAIGVGFILGMFTRWAGIFCALNFAIAIAMVDRFEGMRGIFPSGCLVFIGLYLATHGAGRISVDAGLRANEKPRSNGGVRLKM